MKAGFGKQDITPDLTLSIPGPKGVDNELEFVLDNIWTRALVFKDGDSVVIIVAADIPNFHEKDREDLIQEIKKVCNIKNFELVFHVVHMHQAPNVCWNSFSMVNRDGGHAVSDQYYRIFLNKTALAVQEALEDLAEFDIEYGEDEVKNIESNRRLIGEDGKIFLRGSRPPAKLREYPEGHIDPLVRVFCLKRSGKRNIVWINYCGHPTATGGDAAPFVSGDFPGQALRTLEKENPANEYIYLTGPHGNLNPGKYITGDSENIKDRQNDRDRMGLILARGVKTALGKTKKLKCGSIRFKREKLLLPLREGLPSRPQAEKEYREAIGEMLDVHGRGGKLSHGGKVRFAHRIRYYHSILEDGKIPVFISVMTVGDMNIVFYPGEIFIEANDVVRQRFPEKEMFVVSLCDGLFGYVITEDCYKPENYGYEHSATLLGEGSFTAIVNKAVRMLRKNQELYDTNV
ncbi:MAG: neutral/alkaline non-lysosomal ceramidase N-terminal domain-containing protein [Victivallaceae bacterium]|nr:neutral/alkaline non-lysosomal ceramidase N-terminal domain-containing protein [Victivallaceae bacterium]